MEQEISWLGSIQVSSAYIISVANEVSKSITNIHCCSNRKKMSYLIIGSESRHIALYSCNIGEPARKIEGTDKMD